MFVKCIIADRPVFVAGQIIHHHDVARTQRGSEELLHPRLEANPVDRSIQQAWRDHAMTSQSRDEGKRLSVPVRNFRHQSPAFLATAVCPGHVRLRPGLVDEHQAGRRDGALAGFPLFTPTRDRGTVLFAGAQAFFYR